VFPKNFRLQQNPKLKKICYRLRIAVPYHSSFDFKLKEISKNINLIITVCDSNAKRSGIAVVEIQDVADVISAGEHVTLLPGNGDDVAVHVTQIDQDGGRVRH